jgi:hypothetical protein
MTAKQRTLPRGTPYHQRAIALAKRRGIAIPPLPLNDDQWITLWVEIGKALLPFEPPEPASLRQLWAEVGMFLAEQKEPEFVWGKGRRPGSKSRKPRTLVSGVSAAAIRQRRSRERRKRVTAN